MKAVGAGRPVAGDLLETDRVGVGELGQEQHQSSQEGGQHQQSAEEENWGRKRMKKDHLKGKGWKWEETDIHILWNGIPGQIPTQKNKQRVYKRQRHIW